MGKRVIFVAIIAFLCFVIGGNAFAKGVAFKKILLGKKAYDTIWIDLNNSDVRMTIQVPGGFPLTGESFKSMVDLSRPDAAITGTYFNMSSHVPVGDIVMFGQLIHYGGLGTAMAITGDNKVSFKRVPVGYVLHWDKYETVLAAGPTLLKDGEKDIHPETESFSDPRIFGSAVRCAAGWREDNTLILLTSRGSVSLSELAGVFKHMGCRDAMNLDGGSSSALYCKGSYHRLPKRNLTNILLVFDSPAKYDAYRKACAYTFYKTGDRFRARGKCFQAMLNFRGAAAADPSNAGYFRDLAEAYSNLGWSVWASSALAKAASLYEKKGHGEQALYYYQKALGASDENADAHRWMARYYKTQGNDEKYANEEKALYRCLFTSLALKQSLYTPPGSPIKYKSEWEEKGEGWLHDRTFGIMMKMPEEWEKVSSGDSFQVFQNKDNGNLSFLSIESIKSEVFTDLDKTIEIFREKRGGVIAREGIVEISGFPGKEEVLDDISIDVDGAPWMFHTMYVKRSRFVFALTYGAPAADFSEGDNMLKEVIKTFALDAQFAPYL